MLALSQQHCKRGAVIVGDCVWYFRKAVASTALQAPPVPPLLKCGPTLAQQSRTYHSAPSVSKTRQLVNPGLTQAAWDVHHMPPLSSIFNSSNNKGQ